MGRRKDTPSERLTPAAARAIGDFLGSHTTMTIATNGEDGPWAAALFYAHSADLCLYFISDKSTRHAAHIEQNAEVGVAINGQYQDWFDIRGLQIKGVAKIVPSGQHDDVLKIYLEKYPALDRLFTSPGSEQEKRIARAFGLSPFHQVRPKWIRFIDNGRAFGHREEFSLD
jgi:uncharacterized protein YhbP (UPF0306 family)